MIVKALHRQLKEKSVKTRQCCFNMLTELVTVLPGALTTHIPVLIPGNTHHLSLYQAIHTACPHTRQYTPPVLIPGNPSYFYGSF